MSVRQVHHFGPIPNRVARDRRLTALELRILHVVAAHDRMNANGQGCWAGIARIAAIVDCAPTSARRSICALVNYGYLERGSERAHRGRRQTYRVIYIDEADRSAFENAIERRECVTDPDTRSVMRSTSGYPLDENAYPGRSERVSEAGTPNREQIIPSEADKSHSAKADTTPSGRRPYAPLDGLLRKLVKMLQRGEAAEAMVTVANRDLRAAFETNRWARVQTESEAAAKIREWLADVALAGDLGSGEDTTAEVANRLAAEFEHLAEVLVPGASATTTTTIECPTDPSEEPTVAAVLDDGRPDLEEMLLELFEQVPEWRQHRLAELTERPTAGVVPALERLERDGHIRPLGHGRWERYRPPPGVQTMRSGKPTLTARLLNQLSDGRCLKVAALAKTLRRPPGLVSQALHNLVARGLVERVSRGSYRLAPNVGSVAGKPHAMRPRSLEDDPPTDVILDQSRF